MKVEQIVRKYKKVQFRPTYTSGDNCNLTQAIQNWLEERLPGESAIAEAAQLLTDLHDCSTCGMCSR
jgi:uncharacterized protein (DUF2267 family)